MFPDPPKPVHFFFEWSVVCVRPRPFDLSSPPADCAIGVGRTNRSAAAGCRSPLPARGRKEGTDNRASSETLLAVVLFGVKNLRTGSPERQSPKYCSTTRDGLEKHGNNKTAAAEVVGYR